MDYQVICSEDRSKFEELVLELMKQGWKLQGGVSVNTDPNEEEYYFQAMTLGV